ncbi:MAG: hypothetical protein MUE81_20860, partial [Thermoflexibacter sp.]|nr:hypothetical protein [Thermoflexibacter sp.]
MLLSNHIMAQEDSKDVEKTNNISLRLNLGISWKSTPISNGFCVDFTSPVMTALGPGFIAGCVTIPSNYEKNIQGFGISTGIQFYFPNTKLGVEYMP